MRKINKNMNKRGGSRSDFGMQMRHIAKSKRSAELTIGTLVVIVLAIIVLVVIALGFGTGWTNLWSKITGYFGGGANVDSIKQACTYSCTTKATYDYCCTPKEVVFEKGAAKVKVTCKSDESKLGLEACQEFDCASMCAEQKCLGTLTEAATCPTDTVVDATKKLNSNFKPLTDKEKCCVTAAAVAPSCKSSATSCADLTALQTDCEAQKTSNDAGTTKGTCEYDSTVIPPTCKLKVGQTKVISCDKLDLGSNPALKQKICLEQIGCAWS